MTTTTYCGICGNPKEAGNRCCLRCSECGKRPTKCECVGRCGHCGQPKNDHSKGQCRPKEML